MGTTVWRGLIVVAALVQLEFLRAVVIDEIERKVALLRYDRREFYLDGWARAASAADASPAGRDGTLDEFYAEYERRGRVLERWTWILNAIDPPWLRK